jgi:phage FluMu protein Com
LQVPGFRPGCAVATGTLGHSAETVVGSSNKSELIRFPCEECGKMLGALPGMRIVVCPQCKLDNAVPSRGEAVGSLLDGAYRPQEVRVVSVDVPLPVLMRLGAKVALAAIPLVCLLALAACGVLAVGSAFRDRPSTGVVVPAENPPAAANVEPTPTEAARPGWVGFLGVLLLLIGSLLIGGFFLGLSDRPAGHKWLLDIVLFVFVCLGPFAIGAGLCWWYFR